MSIQIVQKGVWGGPSPPMLSMNPNLNTLFVSISLLAVFFLLAIDLYFCLRTKPIYLTNQQHVIIYNLPLLVSFGFFAGYAADDPAAPVTILIIALFIIVLISFLTNNKIILRSANLGDVTERLNQFLSDQGKVFKIYQIGDKIMTVEINNYKDALIVRDTEKWVEIDSHIHSDAKLLKAVNSFFKGEVKHMKGNPTSPNVFFFVILFILLALFLLLAAFIMGWAWPF